MEKKYDEEQLRAINAGGGYYLVLASPGCGKTDILAERIVRAHASGVSFADMLCLTFTNRASRGMLDRVRERVGESSCDIFVGNVHKFCSAFLNDNSLIPQSTAVIDDDDAADILVDFDSGFFTDNDRPNKRRAAKIDDIDAYISQRALGHPDSVIYLPRDEYEDYYTKAKAADFDPNKINLSSIESSSEYNKYALLHFALRYQRYKKEHNLISFSDLLIKAYEALRVDKEHAYKHYKWIQVDEVQDLNNLQTAIVDELLDKSGEYTLMYLGDEQQAIFSFLGAKVDQLELLRQRCTGNVLTLGTNYRSPKYLLDVFNTYAEVELGVDPVFLPRAVDAAPCGKHDIILTGNVDARAESQRVIAMVNYYIRNEGERVAVLVPTNKAADRVSECLSARGFPHFKISGVDMFKSETYKMLASLFVVAVDDFNHTAWARLLHDVGAVKTGALARRLLARMKSLMMTPTDLFREKTYLARFNEEYMKREFVFFDTETTGLNVLEDDIVQIAAFKVNGGERVPGNDFNIFIHTDKEIPPKLGDAVNPLVEAYAAHRHYSKEEGLRMFLDYIGDCPVLGHNVDYDYHILRSNVERYLHKTITLEVYDSLRLIRRVEPNLPMYKLAFLLKELGLEGENSHLADEDITATKSLVDYCVSRSASLIDEQASFVAHVQVKKIAERARVLLKMIGDLRRHLHHSVKTTNRTIADEIKNVYEEMLQQNIVEPLDKSKFDIFLRYAASEWGDIDSNETLGEQIAAHINDMASISEGDLINSEGLVRDRIFVMTVHKGKGLEFENVIILEANDGTYPFYKVNEVLNAQKFFSPDEVTKAQQERKEDARKLYVALTRAKKRLCVSYNHFNSYGRPCGITPFMKTIEKYFFFGQ